jgi:hypothetical protein
MAFTGKSTFDAGTDLPEIMEDVSDIIGIVSPYETPLLDYLGDAKRSAQSTVHEWIEDALLPNTDTLNQTTFSPDAQNATSLTVTSGARFRVGDQVKPGITSEVMLVTAVSGNTLTVARGYGATTKATLVNGMTLTILGNAALEGDDAAPARTTTRVRKQNYTQIFAATVSVSGSMLAARQHGIADELDFQKQERTRELLRDLENCVLNGVAPASTPQGSGSVRRTMNGVLRQISTNVFQPGQGGIPAGGGAGSTDLTEAVLNTALRKVWEKSSGTIDTIVVGGLQKRQINSFVTQSQAYAPQDDTFRNLVSVYESDFGVCRVIVSRWMPADAVLLLDRSRLEVLPLRGRNFVYHPLGATGDSQTGQVIGEYTAEFRNENAHGVIRGLTAS